MKIIPIAAALIVLNFGINVACAAEESGPDATHVEVGSESLTTLHATVTAINQETREVTLTDAEGNAQTITVSDEVKNLAQVKVGDQVDIAYYESITFEVLPPGQAAAGVAASSVMDSAEAGEKPAAAATAEVSMVATVAAIDKAAGTVDLTGPDGETRKVVVQDPANLDKAKVGDQLLITFTKAVAVGVSAAQSEG